MHAEATKSERQAVNIKDHNLFTHFQGQFDAHAEDELLCDAAGQSFRYKDVNDRSGQIANVLCALGATPGGRVSVQVEKSIECVCLYLACLRAGLVYHPLNIAYTANELSYFLGDARPAIVVCDPANKDAVEKIAAQTGARQVLTMDRFGNGTLADGANRESKDFDTISRQQNDLAALLYSSGTTGVPKGIMLTHWNLLSNTRTLVEAWGFSNTDRLLHALPIFHVHGLFVALGCVLLSGASMRWLQAYKAEQVVQFLPECTVMMGVPTYYTRLLAQPRFSAETAKNMRLFVSGSAPLLEETFTEFEQRTGHRILERYGMTETNMNTSNPLDGERKAGTVGPPLAGVEVCIVDDGGKLLDAGEIGNLQVRGPNVFIGYWNMPDKTAEDFTADGFFNTGDKGCIDEDGYVSIVGRAKDMVITGGLNVYPKEVEQFIDNLDGVNESAVIGVPHADLGEAVVAIVVRSSVSQLSEEAVLAACKGQMAGFKIPKRTIFVAELPRNTMSKVQKNVLRDTYRDLFD
jgi:malonyl-CoA/methylmalonyl-CoA synthetase